MAAKKNEQHPLRIEGYGSAGEGVALYYIYYKYVFAYRWTTIPPLYLQIR